MLRLFRKARQFAIVVLVACTFLTVRVFIINDETLARLRAGPSRKPERTAVPLPEFPDHEPEIVNQKRLLERKPEVILENDKSVSVRTPMLTCDKSLLGIPESVKSKNIASSYDDLTCDTLLRSVPTDSIYKKAKEFMNSFPYQKTPDKGIIELTQNCEAFKSVRGYHLNAVSQNEADYPIAYNILVHKDAVQIEYLLRAIYRPQNVYCIHLDSKQNEDFQNAIKGIANCFDNVYIASKLEHVVYAGYSRLQADINCMKDQVRHDIPWRYLINIAGQSFPLKTNEEVVNILRIYNGANDIEGIYGKRILRGRFDNEWIENQKNGTITKSGKKNPKPPHDIEIVRGSAYGIFSRKFVEFIVSDEKAEALLEWSRNTYSPDEHYWATLHHTYGNPHLKTPGAFAGKPDSKPWMAVWVAWGGVDKCQGQWRRGTCVFGIADLPQLLPHHELFANKFYIEREHLALECLNNWLEYKVTCLSANVDYTFYKKLSYIYKS